MMLVENNEGILLEYGRALVRINGVELFFKHYLATKLTKLSGSSSMTEALDDLDRNHDMLGSKLAMFRERIMPAAHSQYEGLYSALDELNQERIALAHVSSSEQVALDSQGKPTGTGSYVMHSYRNRRGELKPERPLTEEMLKDISLLAERVTGLIYSDLTRSMPR